MPKPAKAYHDRICRALEQLGVVAITDELLLERLSRIAADLEEVERQLAQSPRVLVSTSDNGVEVHRTNPRPRRPDASTRPLNSPIASAPKATWWRACSYSGGPSNYTGNRLSRASGY
ncbi:MAG: hypothetical protein SF066_03825 [Thermoanaerobaculia bacterium]|nr:hypothetical protein [Thermoanaerobaculia bacterium]